jgi:hypothetical protein
MGKASRRKRDRNQPLPGSKPHQPNLAQRIVQRIIPQTHFNQEYGPDFLQAFGPLFLGSFSAPDALVSALSAAGRQIPGPVAGAILIDTGADGTCIAIAAAQQLGLHPTRTQSGFGAGGQHESPVYFARFSFLIGPPGANQTKISWEQELLGIPNLENRTMMNNGKEVAIIGLLGRDVLRNCKMAYDGPGGKLHIKFDLPAIQQDPSR